MKAIICNDLTGYENLTLETIDEPTDISETQVIINVKMAALNFFDTLITRGKYQVKPDLPFSPGGEVAGIITQKGSAVKSVDVGERVMAYIGYGGLREQIVVDASQLVKLPDNVSDEVAASLSITYGTAMHGIMDRGQFKKGEAIAILGAGGGAGLAAVEIAKAMDLTPIAVASNEEKINLAIKHGASIGLNSETQDLKKELKAFNNNTGIEGVYDCVGGDLAEPSLRALNWNGRYLVVGFASGEIPKIPLNLVMLKGIHVSGVFWGRFIEEQPDDFKTHMKQLLLWCDEGKVSPHIEAVYDLDQTVEALSQIADRKSTGKIIIRL